MSDNNDSDIEIIMVSRARKRQEPPLPPAVKLEPGLGDQEVEIIESSPVAGSARPVSAKRETKVTGVNVKKPKHEPKEEIAKKVKRQGPRGVVFQLAKTC